MKIATLLAPLFLLTSLTLAAHAADTTVTLSDVHICCGKCVTGVNTAVAPITGVKAVCDTTARTVVLTAPDTATAQKAVNALTAAGYYGKSADPAIKLDTDTGAVDANVKSLQVTGVHLCCGSCVTAFNDLIKKVPGVTSSTVKANATSISLVGDFNPKTLLDEMHKAGLNGKAAAPK